MVEGKHTKTLLLLSPGQMAGAGRERGPAHPALDWLLHPGDEDVKRLGGECLLPFHLLGDYLHHNRAGLGSLRKRSLLRTEEVFCRERRTGIARSAAHTAAESMLYSVRQYRMDDDPRKGGPCGLLACVKEDGGHFAGTGLLQLGGDFRAAGWTQVPDEKDGPWWKIHESAIQEKIAESGRFKAFFITPALFRKGCLPDLQGIGEDEEMRVTLGISTGNGPVMFILKGACIGPSRPVGGWDVQNRQPKALRRAVPEGSVYFFEAKDWGALAPEDRNAAAAAVMGLCHFKSWCSLAPWPCQTEQGPGREGFGIALIGGW